LSRAEDRRRRTRLLDDVDHARVELCRVVGSDLQTRRNRVRRRVLEPTGTTPVATASIGLLITPADAGAARAVPHTLASGDETSFIS